jgi:hypothetical protein
MVTCYLAMLFYEPSDEEDVDDYIWSLKSCPVFVGVHWKKIPS